MTFASTDAPLAICIVGDDPFGRSLDQLVEGEKVNGRPVVVRRMRRAPERKSCQMVFIDRTDRDVPALLAAIGPGVLTVGEGEGFLREGGIIAFVRQGHHVRFDISQRAATAAALSLSARLLSVARTVEK